MCAVKVHLTTNQPLIIIGAYRPPNRDTLYAQNLCDTIVDISARNPNSLICFNLPDIDWDTDSVSRYRYPLAMNQSLLQMSADCYFTQLVNSPTRDKEIKTSLTFSLQIDPHLLRAAQSNLESVIMTFC